MPEQLSLIDGTDSNKRSIAELQAVLAALPDRLADAQLDLVQSIAKAPVGKPEACPVDHFDKCMRSMLILPRKASDEIGGKLRAELYHRKLGEYPVAALSYLVSTALERCHWFPTIAECIDILGPLTEWSHDAKRRDFCKVRAGKELQARLNDALARMREGAITQAEIDALPEQWKRIADCQCLLRQVEGGGYVLRKLIPIDQRDTGGGGAFASFDERSIARAPDDGQDWI